MQRFTYLVALSLAILAPGLAHASPGASSGADSVCTFDRHISYGASIRPLHPCSGDSLTLVITSCRECDDIVSGVLPSSGPITLEFESRAFCPRLPCSPDSVEIPLGHFRAGHYSFEIEATAHVSSDSSKQCYFTQHDTFTFDVGRCLPPPSPLPYIQVFRIGKRCFECPPTACAGDSIPVFVRGEFPDNCHHFAGFEFGPHIGPGPLLGPPVLRLLVDICHGCPCAAVPTGFAGEVRLPPLPLGEYTLNVEEVWRDSYDPSQIDTVFTSAFPFIVADPCSTVMPPPACFNADWAHNGTPCDTQIDRQHPGLVTMTVNTSAPLSGLQGRLNMYPPGLGVLDIHPVGPAANMKIAWTGTETGAKFVLFSTDGSVIPPTAGAPSPVVRVLLGFRPDIPPAPITYMTTSELVASDPDGAQVPECPIVTPVVVAARICFADRACDFNHDGSSDVRDLVLMVHCVFGNGACPDTNSAALDCNKDGSVALDDVLCCAGVILREGLPDSTQQRPEPAIRVSFGLPSLDGAHLDVPMHITGADRVGAARLALQFPSDRFDVTGVDLPSGTSDWLALHEEDGANLIVGLIGLAPGSGGDGSGTLDVTLHLALKSGQTAAGDLKLASGDFSGRDGVALGVDLAHVTIPIGDVASIALSAPQPNPFSRTTQFSVTLPRAGNVELRVHDLAGRTVATLFRGAIAAGTRAFSWTGKDDGGAPVRDGIYFVRIQGTGSNVTRKVILLHGSD